MEIQCRLLSLGLSLHSLILNLQIVIPSLDAFMRHMKKKIIYDDSSSKVHKETYFFIQCRA